MSYDIPLDNQRRDKAPTFQTLKTPDVPGRCALSVRLQAGASALPRLFNLMSKLDIEPNGLHAAKSACGQSLTVAIDLGADHEAMARLELRLKGLVTVLDAERIPAGGREMRALSPPARDHTRMATAL